MGTSPDVGGRSGLGRPLVPEHYELETTAQVVVARQGLGLVPNTLEIPFTKLGGDVYKYQANPSKPKLATNVLVAASHPERPKPDQEIANQFKKLLEEIPLKLNLELAKEMKKPAHLRDPRYVVVEKLLRFVAAALVWLRRVEEGKYRSSKESQTKNIMNPLVTLRGWNFQVEEVLKSLNQQAKRGIIEKVVYTDNKDIFEPIVDLAKEIFAAKEEEYETLLDELFKQTNALYLRFKTNKLPNIVPLLGHFLTILHTLSAVLTYRHKSPAFLHLAYAETILLKNEKRDSGIGMGYRTIIHHMIEVIPDLTEPQKILFSDIASFMMILFSSLIVEASGIAKATTLKLTEQPEKIQSFAFMLASTLLTHSGILQETTSLLLEKIELVDELNKVYTAAITTLTLSAFLLAGSKGDKTLKAIDPLLRSVKEPLLEELRVLKEFFAKTEKTQEALSLSNAVRQGSLALKNLTASGYLEAVQAALKPLQHTLQSTQYESESIVTFAWILLNNIYQVAEQEEFTSAVIQAA